MSKEKILTEEEKKFLLKIARDTLNSYAKTRSIPELPPPDTLSEGLKAKNGAFVTLHKQGELRGCIGVFEGRGPLYKTISQMTVSSGWEDPRFPPVKESELDKIDIEISVLSPLTTITDVSLIEVGKHGIYITRGFYRGVLLPQVATEHKWNREEFLEATCQKAGLEPDAWKHKDTQIQIFTAEVFGERDYQK